jgi:hypothetical protein
VLESELGRWMRRDPIGYVDGASIQWYCVSNPIVNTDPAGLCAKRIYDRIVQGRTHDMQCGLKLLTTLEWCCGAAGVPPASCVLDARKAYLSCSRPFVPLPPVIPPVVPPPAPGAPAAPAPGPAPKVPTCYTNICSTTGTLEDCHTCCILMCPSVDWNSCQAACTGKPKKMIGRRIFNKPPLFPWGEDIVEH